MNKQAESSDSLLEIEEVARRMSEISGRMVSYFKVYSFCRSNNVPMKKIGKKNYVSLNDLLDMRVSVPISRIFNR